MARAAVRGGAWRGRLAAILLWVASPAIAGAAEVRVEGTSDPEAQAIAEAATAVLGDLEAAGFDLRFDGAATVVPSDAASYRLTLPSAVVVSSGGEATLSLGTVVADITPRGPGRYAFEVAPLMPFRWQSASGSAVDVRIVEQQFEGVWNAALGGLAESALDWRGLEVAASGDAPGVRIRVDRIEAASTVRLSPDGATVAYRSTGAVENAVVESGTGLFGLALARASGRVDGAEVTVEDYHAGGLLNARVRLDGTAPSPEEALSRIRAVLSGAAGQEETRFELSGLRAFNPGGSVRIGQLQGGQTLNRGFVYDFQLSDLVIQMSGGNAMPLDIVLSSAAGETRTVLDGPSMTSGSTQLDYRGLAVGGPYSAFFPARGRVAFGAEQVPFTDLFRSSNALVPSAPNDPGRFLAAVWAALARSQAQATLDVLNLGDGGVTATLEGPVTYDFAARGFTTDPNRITVGGLGSLVAALSQNFSDNRQILGFLAVAMAMGRPEARDDETVHAYEFSNGPNGGILLNGRPLGAPPQ